MKRIRLVTLATIATLAAACGSQDVVPEARDIELHATSESDTSGIAQLGRLQQELLRALADTTADPTPYIGGSFRIVDPNDSSTVRRTGFDGRPVGPSIFATLNRRVASGFSQVESLEARLMRPGAAVTFVRHPAGLNSITYWSRSGDSWTATMILINLDEQQFAQASRMHAQS